MRFASSIRWSCLCFFALASAGCQLFEPRSGLLACNASGKACPDGYYCASDGTCWKEGESPTGDLSVAGGDLLGPDVDLGGERIDLRGAADLAAGDLTDSVTDLAGVDLAGADLAVADLSTFDLTFRPVDSAAMPPDQSIVLDLTIRDLAVADLVSKPDLTVVVPPDAASCPENAMNCGGCAMACSANHISPACTGGNCTGACIGAFLDCNGNKRADGCECDGATSLCAGGGCLKKDGQACVVNGDCTSGSCCGNLCVNVQISLAHCGACNSPCGAKADACVGGVCKCNGGPVCNVAQSAGGGQRCDGANGCVCDGISCGVGCCSAVKMGICFSGVSQGACGIGGTICENCGLALDGPVCVNRHCGCNSAMDCPSQPIPHACDQIAQKCVTSCKVGQDCNAGCCDVPNKTCVDGTANNACGNSGMACLNCGGICFQGLCQ